MEEQWSIKDASTWSDELKSIIQLITGGNLPGKPVKEEERTDETQ